MFEYFILSDNILYYQDFKSFAASSFYHEPCAKLNLIIYLFFRETNRTHVHHQHHLQVMICMIVALMTQLIQACI